MQEKTEWELIDEPVRPSGYRRHAHDDAQGATQGGAQGASGMKMLFQAMLGPWWRWKLVGAGLFAALVMVMVAMLTGVVALVAAATAALAIAIGKIRQWTRRQSGALVP